MFISMKDFIHEVCCLVSCCLLFCSCLGTNHEKQTGGQCFYLDAVSGNDDNTGESPSLAWQSLERASKQTYMAGDRLLLKRGDTFVGTLEFTGEGTAENRVYLDAYGDKKMERPKIDGEGGLYTVHVYNSSYVTIQNLEITNMGQLPRERSGLKVECNDYGTSRNIVINNLFIHDVNGQMVKGKGRGCGIFLVNQGKKKRSRFENMIIENCHIKSCTRDGIIWAGGRYIHRNEAPYDWFPNLNTIIRNNLIEKVAGDAIVPVGCDQTLIEYNVVRDWLDILKHTPSAGIWPWSSDNTVIQFNDVSGFRSDSDGQAFDSDFNCKNTIIQYNYSHDNEGGMVLLCDDPGAKFSAGVLDTQIRYNISINDGHRRMSKQREPSPAIHFTGPATDALIERNIIHANPKKEADTYRLMLRLSDWRPFPDNPIFRENIFYTSESSGFIVGNKPFTFEGNWYLGDHKFSWLFEREVAGAGDETGLTTGDYDKTARTTSEVYQREVLDVDPQGYQGLYKLMEKRMVGGQEHCFVKKDAIEAFFARMENDKKE